MGRGLIGLTKISLLNFLECDPLTSTNLQHEAQPSPIWGGGGRDRPKKQNLVNIYS